MVLGTLFAACGGRADHPDVAQAAGGTTGNGTPPAGTSASGAATDAATSGAAQGAGQTDAGSGEGGVAALGSEQEQAGAGGVSGDTGITGVAGEGGAGDEAPTLAAFLGDYDVYLTAPPSVPGCEVAWYEPRLNLAVSRNDSGALEVLPFADFAWQGNFAAEPRAHASSIEIDPVSDWAGAPRSPAFSLSSGAYGFVGTGSAEIPYTCPGGAVTTRRVSVQVEEDRTAPKLRVDPSAYKSFGFTRFGFTFSEPVELPSGAFDVMFREPADGEQLVALYDTASNAALPIAWKWALAGPVALARFLDPGSVEGRTIAARLLEPVTDRAGNPVQPPAQTLDIGKSAVLESALDFDQAPSAGIYGNASYHAAAGPSAECEQGGCLVLDGPVVACYEAPQSTLAVRFTSPWEKVRLRYRAWASTGSASPIEIGYASGCSGMLSSQLAPLPQADGVFTHASAWETVTLSPCGGPENENGFTLSLGCAESQPAPQVRVIIERLALQAAE